MACSGCGRTISIWKRDFSSRLCQECQHGARLLARLKERGLQTDQWTRAIHEYAAHLTRCGASREEIEKRLVAADQEPRVAGVVALAAALQRDGITLQNIPAQLARHGIDAEVASRVAADMAEVPVRRPQNAQLHRQWILSMVVGLAIILLGIVASSMIALPGLAKLTTILGIGVIAAGFRARALKR